MHSLHLHDVSYAPTSAIPVLDRVTLDVSDTGGRWIGAVGANGAGKTTLLRLLAGELAPGHGEVAVDARVPPLLVPQEVAHLTDDVRTFAVAWDGPAERLRRRLDLDPDDLEARWSAHSPGQRKRWQVAAALAAAPDILLLDEPTNHLDGDARDLVVAALERFRGLGIVVSHDRGVLDRLTDRTLRVQDGGVELHAGSYTEASMRWRADEAAVRQAHDRARRRERTVRRQLADARRDRAGTQQGAAAQRRNASHRTHDQRSTAQTERASRAEAAHASRVGATRSRLERAQADVAAFDLQRQRGGAVAFGHTLSGRRRLATVTGAIRHAGGDVLLRGVDLTLRRGERVHLAGVNGAGKTTLLRALVDSLAATAETVALLPQDLDDPAAEVARVGRLDPGQRGRVLGTVALLGVDPDRVLVTDAPSPGQARKLALARLLATSMSVLVLDEPTNHLDLTSIERLEQALRSWPGTLVLITHDDALAAATTTSRWEVGEGRVTVTTSTSSPGRPG